MSTVAALLHQLAEAKAEVQTARERAEAAEAEAATLRAAAAGGGGGAAVPAAPPAPGARLFPALAAALQCMRARVVDSPTKAGVPSIQGELTCMDMQARPLAPDLAALSAAPSLRSWQETTLSGMLHETSAYPIATAFVPEWVAAQPRPAHRSKGAQSASSLFLAGAGGYPPPVLPGASVAWSCMPELLTAPRAPFHPGFTGEIKSATSANEASGEGRLFDGLLTHGLLAMLGS